MITVGIMLDKSVNVGVICKLSPSWKNHPKKLIYKKGDLTLDQLLQHVHVKEEQEFVTRTI